jgi:uncharacterized protein YutD
MQVIKEETCLIRTQAGTYEVIEENRDGWNPEAFKERYSDILDKYDYIVGDWGYGQLRLRGFYDNANRKVPFEQKIAALDEYLHEFCNFGCPYFVLKKVKAAQLAPGESPSEADEASITLDLHAVTGAEQSIPYLERKERRRFHQRPNRQDRPERQNGSGSGRDDRPNRHDRNNKPLRSEQGKSEKNWRGERGGRRNQSLRSNNRDQDKVSASSVPPQNKRD